MFNSAVVVQTGQGWNTVKNQPENNLTKIQAMKITQHLKEEVLEVD